MYDIPDIDELKALGYDSPYLTDKRKLVMLLYGLEEVKKELAELKQLISKKDKNK